MTALARSLSPRQRGADRRGRGIQVSLATPAPVTSYPAMPRPRPSPLWLRLAGPMLLFVAASSIVLALWIHANATRESRAVFATLAHTNADFIRSARLSQNERVAESIGRVLGMDVFFRKGAWDLTAGGKGSLQFHRGQELTPPPAGALVELTERIGNLQAEEGIVRLGTGFEAIAVLIDSETSLIVVRPVEPALRFLLQPQTLFVLSAFWVFSVALAWTLARGLVRPLRQLAARLPHIQDDSEPTLPGAERTDEIGQLVRAYLQARAQLVTERAEREKIERLALLGRMATGLAHEIHNPLAAIRMHAQLIDSAPPLERATAARDSLPVLLGETARIESLVNQWMFLARPAPPQTTLADISTLVAQVVRALAPQAAHAEVQLIDQTAPKLWAQIDARRIAQAIGNVLLNAIQALPSGGSVTIRGELLDEAVAAKSSLQPPASSSRHPTVRITFRDTGAGFSPRALVQHAELFFSEKEGGMGIGLSVTSEILRAHGGSLHVANGAAGGALVTFILPARASDSSSSSTFPIAAGTKQ